MPWAHNYDQPPVAKALNVKVQDRKLKFLLQFATKGEYGFADTIYQLYKGGYLSAFSVGFQPIKYEHVERRLNGRKIQGRDYIEQELWEISAVSLPSNPNALVAAKKKGLISNGEFSFIYERRVLEQLAKQMIEGKIRKLVNKRIQEHIIDQKLKNHGLIGE